MNKKAKKVKKGKKVKRVIFSIIGILLVVVIVFAAGMFCYYPHYKSSKHEIAAKNQNLDEIRVMSCNLRTISPTDFGKKSWFYRADLILKNIENNNPGIIGFQECTKWHYKYLVDTLKGFDSVITYRDKSTFSEGCPVFYRTDLYTLKDKGSFWLSETPEEMSKDWGSACYRVCSYVILEQKSTKKDFVVFNTHLDHISDEARIKGIGVVIDKIKQFGSLPSMIMGDFNAVEDSETYRSVTKNFIDAKYQTDNPTKQATYQNWGKSLDRECIDYLMISKTGIKAKTYKVVDSTYDGVYPSDHFPIFLTLELTKGTD